MVPIGKKGVEIGIGTGIFAEQLGIRYGTDPSEKMLVFARQRGLDVQNGVAEQLPYESESFDFTVFINAICFVDDPDRALREASGTKQFQSNLHFTNPGKSRYFRNRETGGRFWERQFSKNHYSRKIIFPG